MLHFPVLALPATLLAPPPPPSIHSCAINPPLPLPFPPLPAPCPPLHPRIPSPPPPTSLLTPPPPLQLRNLVWATSRNDVFVVHDNCVEHWNPATRRRSPVLDLSGGPNTRRLPGVGPVQVGGGERGKWR